MNHHGKKEALHSRALELRVRGLTYRRMGKLLRISRQRAQQLVRPSQEIRELIAASALWRCMTCSVRLGRSGHVHHMKHLGISVDAYNMPSNLLYLCPACHRRVHSRDLRRRPRPNIGLISHQRAVARRRNERRRRRQIGPILYRHVRAAFIASGSSIHGWLVRNGFNNSPSAAREAILFGCVGEKANRIRRKILHITGIDEAAIRAAGLTEGGAE
jgi:hypothetical protein